MTMIYVRDEAPVPMERHYEIVRCTRCGTKRKHDKRCARCGK